MEKAHRRHRVICLLLIVTFAASAEDNLSRLHQHKVTAKESPAPEPGAENELIPSLVEGVNSAAEWYNTKRPELMKLWMQILGKIEPDKRDHRWFGDIRKAVIRDRRELDKYSRLEVDLPIEKDFYQHHLLLLPTNQGRGPFPAVVCWTSSSPDYTAPEQWWGGWLAEHGYVVLTSWSYVSTNDGHKPTGPDIDPAWRAFFERWLKETPIK
jgi:hypothetical protein